MLPKCVIKKLQCVKQYVPSIAFKSDIAL